VTAARKVAATCLADALILFVCAALLIWPLFKAGYLDKWASIESTFISDARFLNDHWPHPLWQPLWYCGTRFDYVYPPALRYGTAAIARWAGVPTVRSYHIYTAFFYCVAIAGVYVFVRVSSGSRRLAWLAAAASALLSPSFLFLNEVRNDSGFLVPQRLGVLVRYGEGPHISAWALVPLALAATWRAVEGFRPGWLAAAAILCGLVVSNNFYGATALAIFFPILLWSLWITHLDRRMWLRAAAIPGLAYGLVAFWLVPSYIRLTLFNMRFVSQPGKSWSMWAFAGAAVLYVLLSSDLARGRPDLAYPLFAWSAALFTSLIVFGWYLYDFRIIGEAIRLIPELDFALTLVALEGLRWMWNRHSRQRWLLRAAAVGVAVLCFASSRHYIRRAWSIYVPDPHYQERIEYRITRWMHENMPTSRALAAGSVRFWYNAWYDLAQIGGGSEQGLLNPIVIPAQWVIMHGTNPQDGVAWLQATGGDAVLVHGKTSQEIYHDFEDPSKFAGTLPVAYDNGAGDTIYLVPHRFPGLARVLDRAGMKRLGPARAVPDVALVNAYAALLDSGPDSPAPSRWVSTDEMRIHATIAEGQSLTVLESYDPAWRAYSRENPLAIAKDALGFMRIDAPPGEHDVRLVFELPLENIAGRILSTLSGLLALSLSILAVRGRR
jgi:hypothetical protein